MEVILKNYSATASNPLNANRGLKIKSSEEKAAWDSKDPDRAPKLAGAYAKDLQSASDAKENRLKVELALKALQAARPESYSRYQIRVNAENKKLQIQLINHETGEVIEEIPSQRLLDFYSVIEELNNAFFARKA